MTVKTVETTTPPAVAEEGFQVGAADSITVTTETAPVTAPETTQVVTTQPGQQFTAEDIENARKQEKDKLYGRLEKLQEQVDVFAKARQEQEEAERQAAAAAEEQRRQQELEEMSAKEAIKSIEDELTAKMNTLSLTYEEKLAAVQEELRAKEALLERERQLQELESHKSRLLAANADRIVPDLLDLVSGNTPEELEASISTLVAKSDAIMENIQQTLPTQRLRGVPATGASTTGPAETQTEQQTYTADDISKMSNEEYAKVRDRLLNAASGRR